MTMMKLTFQVVSVRLVGPFIFAINENFVANNHAKRVCAKRHQWRRWRGQLLIFSEECRTHPFIVSWCYILIAKASFDKGFIMSI